MVQSVSRLDVRRYQEMLQQGDAMTFRDETGTGGTGVFELRCSSSETDSPFIRCREEVEYERQLALVFASMRERGELTNRASWKYSACLLLHIVYGSCIFMIIGARIAISNYDDGQLAGRRPSMRGGIPSICLPFPCRVVRRFL